MSVVSIETSRGGKTGSRELNKYKFDAERQFEILTDDITDDEVVVISACITEVGDVTSYHPNHLGAICTKIDARQSSDSPLMWTVTYTYTTDPGINPEQANPDPMQRPPQLKINFNESDKPFTIDEDNEEVLNSAKQPIAGVSLPDSQAVLTFSINKPTLLHDQVMELNGAINETCWGKYPAKTLRAAVEADPQWENDEEYYRYNYTLTIKKDGWNPFKLLDRGFMQLDEDGVLQQIRGQDGQPVSEEALLDGTGKKLEENEEPVFISFKGYREVDFHTLIFPWECEAGEGE